MITSFIAVSETSWFSNPKKQFSIYDGSRKIFEFNLINGRYKRDFMNVEVDNELKLFVSKHGWPVKNPFVFVEYVWRYKNEK